MKTELEHAFGRAFGRRDVTSPRMQAAIREWFDLYFGRAFPGEDPADRLPVLIVSKLCRAVFAEYESRLRPGGAKTDWMTGNLRALDAVRGRAMQAALVGGECLLKPVPAGAGFEFVPVRRDHFLPLGRDLQGRLQAVGTMQRISRGGRRYALLERRTAGEKGLTIETRLFELAGETLGREVPLDTLPETEALRPTLLLPGVSGVGLAVLRTPMANCVDGSPDPVAVFAPAAGLLHRLGRTEHGLSREFENGASRVFASEDLLRGEGPGDRALTDDLFVGLPEDPANLGVTVYSPALREQSYLARKQDILRGCESLIGLRRGTLCEAETAERTATEITATGADAVLVWAWNCIHTERFAHDVFTSDYGQDLAGLIGKPYGDEVRQSEAVRKLREALLINPYITSVDQVSATFEGSWLHVSFSLHTIYGEVSVRDAAIGI